MSQTYVTKELRERVAVQARFRCGYCLTAEAIVGTPMEIEHLIPESLGGATEETNLWLACSLCNDHKSNRIAATDSESGEIVRLFDPRRQVWTEHFRWNEHGEEIVGLTATGPGHGRSIAAQSPFVGTGPSALGCRRLAPTDR
jgi:hypothetical protein